MFTILGSSAALINEEAIACADDATMARKWRYDDATAGAGAMGSGPANGSRHGDGVNGTDSQLVAAGTPTPNPHERDGTETRDGRGSGTGSGDVALADAAVSARAATSAPGSGGGDHAGDSPAEVVAAYSNADIATRAATTAVAPRAPTSSGRHLSNKLLRRAAVLMRQHHDGLGVRGRAVDLDAQADIVDVSQFLVTVAPNVGFVWHHRGVITLSLIEGMISFYIT